MVSLAKIKEMSWLSGKRAGLLFGLVIVALVVVAIVSVQGAMNLAQAGRWVAHTLEVMQDVQKTYVALSEAQAAQRSYVIIGDEGFLHTFRESVEAVHSQLHRLRAMTADNPRELENLNRLEQLVEDRIRIMNETIAVYREQGFDAAKEEISTQRGLRAMQVVDSTIDSMILQERRLLDERTEASDRAAGWLIGAIAAGMFVTVALLGCVYWLVRRDAEQRAQAAEIMRRSEERFRAFMDNIPALAFMKDDEGRFTYKNASFERLFQQECTDILGAAEAQRWLERTARQFEANDRRLCETGTLLETTETTEMPTGQSREWLVYRFPVVDATGQKLLGGVALDITERKQAEEKFRLAVESCPNGMIMIDRQGKIVMVNTQIERMFGYQREELIGQLVDKLVPSRFRGKHPEHRVQFMASPSARLMGQGRDLYGLRKDGREFPVEIGLQPIVTKDGLFVLSAIVDITHRKQAEAALQQFAARLQRSNRELQDFAYVSSHDLQEPLRKIQAFGERLKNQFSQSLSDQGRDYVDRMQKAATRMRTLIEDLLKFSRITTKAQPFTQVDLNAVVREVLDDLEVTMEHSGGRVSVGELPVIDADPLQMRQLIQNLVGNALKFRRPNEPPVIDIRASLLEGGSAHDQRQWQITVEDNGIGFDNKYAERVFEVFQRLHERDQYEGSGIGLAICRKIVERHNGRVVAHGKQGVGATFEITLPVHQAESKEESEEAPCQREEEAFSY